MSRSDEVAESQAEEAQARHVHAFLKTAIVFGALAAGTAVTVGALARRHRVSAEAARDALTRLEDEGLVGRETSDSAVVSGAAQRLGGLGKRTERWWRRTKDAGAGDATD